MHDLTENFVIKIIKRVIHMCACNECALAANQHKASDKISNELNWLLYSFHVNEAFFFCFVKLSQAKNVITIENVHIVVWDGGDK